MIARPLDLASRLRPPPHGTGALHYVNVGLLGLFFSLFGSRFVLAPGMGVDFQLPQLPGAQSGAAQTTDVISVLRSGQIFTSDQGLVDLEQLKLWLKARAGRDAGLRNVCHRAWHQPGRARCPGVERRHRQSRGLHRRVARSVADGRHDQ